MISFISLIPILIYLFVLKVLDSFALARWKMLCLCLSVGIFSCAASFGLSKCWQWSGMWMAPLIEEVLKGCLLVWFIRTRKIRFLAEALIYGAAVGGGFSMLENIIYLFYNSDMLFGTAMFRGFGVAVMHMGCTSLVAVMMLMTLNPKYPQKLMTVLAFVPSILIHIVHNSIEITPSLRLILTIVLFFILFLSIFSLGEKLIYRWMDHSISVDVQTLSAIKKGNFMETKAGQYLLSVKEQFAPEVFFDIICCVEIHLELKIEKQSRMLLVQAGFESAISPEEKKSQDMKEQEEKALLKRIGRTGKWVIHPLVED